jgi:hypothetical protein
MRNSNDVASNEKLWGAGPVPARRGCERVGWKRRVADTGVTTNASCVSVGAKTNFGRHASQVKRRASVQ